MASRAAVKSGSEPALFSLEVLPRVETGAKHLTELCRRHLNSPFCPSVVFNYLCTQAIEP